MKISEKCVKCLYDKQAKRASYHGEYLAEIKKIIDNRTDSDSAPYMVYKFNKVYERYFGAVKSLCEEKKKYNNMVLEMETRLREKILQSEDPLKTALVLSRIGNYIDFAAQDDIDDETFLELFSDIVMRDDEQSAYESFLEQCQRGKRFLLIADNCGEIVLDKLFVEELQKHFPHLEVYVMVRGAEIQNDATLEDANYVGIQNVAKLVTNGAAIPGVVYSKLDSEARNIFLESDVILAKGQGNYESLSGNGWHIFYTFLCKCEGFTERFNVSKLTGMFVEEME
ncbi:MAG: ARMT1-like domain-containing protein [Eubacterium sp.]|nr:ARMT1-like domain-containing protein [Eubacterium sp.]